MAQLLDRLFEKWVMTDGESAKTFGEWLTERRELAQAKRAFLRQYPRDSVSYMHQLMMQPWVTGVQQQPSLGPIGTIIEFAGGMLGAIP